MSNLTEQLIRTLSREQEIYQEVLDLADKKKQIILEGRLRDLEDVTKREQEIVGILIKLENIRSQTAEQLAAEKGIQAPGTLRELIPSLPADVQLEVSKLHSTLRQTIGTLQDKNDLNGRLLKQSLEIVDFNLNLLTSINAVSGGYGSDASEKDENQRKSLFDVKV